MSKISYQEYINKLLEQLEKFEVRDYRNFIAKLAVAKSSQNRPIFLNFIEEVLNDRGEKSDPICFEILQ